MRLMAYIDGSCLGNPGECGYGVVLQNESGQTLMTRGSYIGKGTNNSAEYHGLLGAIQMAQSLKAKSLKVFSDSELLVRQINGEYRVKQSHLIELYQQVKKQLKQTGLEMYMEHIYREKNKLADQLARHAIRIKGDVN